MALIKFDPEKNSPDDLILKDCPNFKWKEVGCNCKKHKKVTKKRTIMYEDSAFIDEKLLKALQQLRNIVKKPITVTCVYRCDTHNRAVGGVDGSFHTKGMAADIYCSGVSVEQLAKYAAMVPAFNEGGIGKYYKKNFVHVDIYHKEGSKGRRWIG